jgi:hypothetical protein
MVKQTRRQQKGQQQKKQQKQQKQQEGGRRKGTRKLGKKASAWHMSVMKVYKDMKKADPSTKLMDAMKKAAQLKKKGQL